MFGVVRCKIPLTKIGNPQTKGDKLGMYQDVKRSAREVTCETRRDRRWRVANVEGCRVRGSLTAAGPAAARQRVMAQGPSGWSGDCECGEELMREKAWPSGMTGGGSSRGPAECRFTSSAKTLSCPCEPHLKSRFPAVLPPRAASIPP